MRVKWLSLSPREYDFGLLGRNIVSNPYMDEVGQGFVTSVFTDTEIESKFYNKLVDLRETITPSGEIIKEEQVYYDIAKFTLRKWSPYLRVDKLPRRNSVFLLAMGKLMEFDLAFVPMEFDVQFILESLREEFDKVVIDKLKMKGDGTNDPIQANIVLAGVLSIDKSMAMFDDEFNLSINRTWITVFKMGKSYKLEIDKKGEIVVADQDSKYLINIIDNLIHKAVEQPS